MVRPVVDQPAVTIEFLFAKRSAAMRTHNRVETLARFAAVLEALIAQAVAYYVARSAADTYKLVGHGVGALYTLPLPPAAAFQQRRRDKDRGKAGTDPHL